MSQMQTNLDCPRCDYNGPATIFTNLGADVVCPSCRRIVAEVRKATCPECGYDGPCLCTASLDTHTEYICTQCGHLISKPRAVED